MYLIDLIGNTPLIELKRIPKNNSSNKLFVKMEELNPSGSVKDRPVLQMIEDAEARGYLSPGGTIIESSSGNTGVSLAMIGNIKGYKVILVVDPKTPKIQVSKMKSFGANVICVDKKDEFGNYQKTRIEAIKKILNNNPDYYWINQYSNESAFYAHYKTTGEEICNSINRITHIVAAISTGATLLGTAKKIKERHQSVKVVAVDSEGSSIFGQVRKPSKLKGIGSSFRTEIIQKYCYLIDEVIIVSDSDAFKYSKLLANLESIFSGPSSGCVLKAMLDIDKKNNDSSIVGILPDRGEYYDSMYDLYWLQGNENSGI